jgi:hypothetical protein
MPDLVSRMCHLTFVPYLPILHHRTLYSIPIRLTSHSVVRGIPGSSRYEYSSEGGRGNRPARPCDLTAQRMGSGYFDWTSMPAHLVTRDYPLTHLMYRHRGTGLYSRPIFFSPTSHYLLARRVNPLVPAFLDTIRTLIPLKSIHLALPVPLILKKACTSLEESDLSSGFYHWPAAELTPRAAIDLL